PFGNAAPSTTSPQEASHDAQYRTHAYYSYGQPATSARAGGSDRRTRSARAAGGPDLRRESPQGSRRNSAPGNHPRRRYRERWRNGASELRIVYHRACDGIRRRAATDAGFRRIEDVSGLLRDFSAEPTRDLQRTHQMARPRARAARYRRH